MVKDDVVVAPKTQAAVAEVVNETTGPEVTRADASANTAMVLAAIQSDPKLRNQFSQEPVVQSGVVWGGSSGVLMSAAVILREIGKNGTDLADYDMGIMVPALGALGAAIFTLYRRLAPGLKPLFSGWFGSK